MNYSQGKYLKWSLIGLVLIPTTLVWFVIGSSLFGYRLASLQGTSMEPALRHGDALWTKCVGPAEVKVGDIVCFEDKPIYGIITHRVINIVPLRNSGYLLETKGDANYCSEVWEIGLDEKLRVSVARIGYAGYVLEFLGSIGGIVLIIGLVALAIAIYVHRGRKLL